LLHNARKPLIKETRNEVFKQNIPAGDISHVCKAHLRYESTDSALLIDIADYEEMKENFERAHKQRFGFIAKERNLVIEALSVEAVGMTESRIDEEEDPQENVPLYNQSIPLICSATESGKKLHFIYVMILLPDKSSQDPL